jgi:hypothetical protein
VIVVMHIAAIVALNNFNFTNYISGTNVPLYYLLTIVEMHIFSSANLKN